MEANARTKLYHCLIRESSKFQVRHAAVIVNHEHVRVTLLECDKVSLLVLRIAKKLEAVLDELFHRREGREPLGALFCNLIVSTANARGLCQWLSTYRLIVNTSTDDCNVIGDRLITLATWHVAVIQSSSDRDDLGVDTPSQLDGSLEIVLLGSCSTRDFHGFIVNFISSCSQSAASQSSNVRIMCPGIPLLPTAAHRLLPILTSSAR